MKLLFINACVRGENSRTLELADRYIEMINDNEEVKTIERDLSKESIAYMTNTDFDEKGQSIYPYDMELAEEFAKADHIVIAAPFWEFEFPAILNIYIEMISKAGITFQYTEKGSAGLCTAEQLTYIYTAGGYLKEEEKIGEMKLKQLTKLYGIKKFQSIYADGLDVIPEKADEILRNKISKL